MELRWKPRVDTSFVERGSKVDGKHINGETTEFFQFHTVVVVDLMHVVERMQRR